MPNRRGTIRVSDGLSDFVDIAFSPDPGEGVTIRAVSGKKPSEDGGPIHFVRKEYLDQFISELVLARDLCMDKQPRRAAATAAPEGDAA